MQFNKTALGLTAGILWGGAVFFATIWTAMWGRGDHLLLLASFYIGYSVSPIGALVGLVYGFVDGFVCGWVFAWLYNRLARPKAATG